MDKNSTTYGFVCFLWGHVPGGHARTASRLAAQIERTGLGKVERIAISRRVSSKWSEMEREWVQLPMGRWGAMASSLRSLAGALARTESPPAESVQSLGAHTRRRRRRPHVARPSSQS